MILQWLCILSLPLFLPLQSMFLDLGPEVFCLRVLTVPLSPLWYWRGGSDGAQNIGLFIHSPLIPTWACNLTFPTLLFPPLISYLDYITSGPDWPGGLNLPLIGGNHFIVFIVMLHWARRALFTLQNLTFQICPQTICTRGRYESETQASNIWSTIWSTIKFL